MVILILRLLVNMLLPILQLIAVIGGIIRETWERVRDSNTVHIPKSCYYNVKDIDTKLDAVHRIS